MPRVALPSALVVQVVLSVASQLPREHVDRVLESQQWSPRRLVMLVHRVAELRAIRRSPERTLIDIERTLIWLILQMMQIQT